MSASGSDDERPSIPAEFFSFSKHPEATVQSNAYIISTRIEMLVPRELPPLVVLNKEQGGDSNTQRANIRSKNSWMGSKEDGHANVTPFQGNRDTVGVLVDTNQQVPTLCIDRGISRSPEVVSHYYAITPFTLQKLQQLVLENQNAGETHVLPSLVEDAQILHLLLQAQGISTDNNNGSLLRSGGVDSSVDQSLLSENMSTGCSNGGGGGIRGVLHRRVKQLQHENSMFREILEIGRNVKPTQAHQRTSDPSNNKVLSMEYLHKKLSHLIQREVRAFEMNEKSFQKEPTGAKEEEGEKVNQDPDQKTPEKQRQPEQEGASSVKREFLHSSKGTRLHHQHRVQTTETASQTLSEAEAADAASGKRGAHSWATDTPIPLSVEGAHSPLLWEMETVAAINARTRYDANKPRVKHIKGRLDPVTQHQLGIRLHDKSQDQKKQRIQEIEEKVMRELGLHEHKVLSVEEQHELGVRLHDQWRTHCAKGKADLAGKYLRDLSPKKKLTWEEQKESAVRQHNKTMEKKEEGMKQLVQKYIYDQDDPKMKQRLSPQQQKEMADRLSTYFVRDYKGAK